MLVVNLLLQPDLEPPRLQKLYRLADKVLFLDRLVTAGRHQCYGIAGLQFGRMDHGFT